MYSWSESRLRVDACHPLPPASEGYFLSACVLKLALVVIDIVDSDFLECLQTIVHSEHVEGNFVLLEWNREADLRESIYELQAVQVTS